MWLARARPSVSSRGGGRGLRTDVVTGSHLVVVEWSWSSGRVVEWSSHAGPVRHVVKMCRRPNSWRSRATPTGCACPNRLGIRAPGRSSSPLGHRVAPRATHPMVTVSATDVSPGRWRLERRFDASTCSCGTPRPVQQHPRSSPDRTWTVHREVARDAPSPVRATHEGWERRERPGEPFPYQSLPVNSAVNPESGPAKVPTRTLRAGIEDALIYSFTRANAQLVLAEELSSPAPTTLATRPKPTPSERSSTATCIPGRCRSSWRSPVGWTPRSRVSETCLADLRRYIDAYDRGGSVEGPTKNPIFAANGPTAYRPGHSAASSARVEHGSPATTRA